MHSPDPCSVELFLVLVICCRSVTSNPEEKKADGHMDVNKWYLALSST